MALIYDSATPKVLCYDFFVPETEVVADSLAVRGSQVLATVQVAVIGYGNQGTSHALNLRDSGIAVTVGGRLGSESLRRAHEDGFAGSEAAQAAAGADLVIVALPDECHGVACPPLLEAMKPNAVIGFLHGFSVHFRQVNCPPQRGVVLVAPKGPGSALRARFLEGFGIPSLVAVHQGGIDPPRAEDLALGWAHAIGSGRAGIIRTTFKDETETDLFGEQAVLCGGLGELIRIAYETLVEAGYPPLLAYTECCHEVKQIADLICDRGIAGMGNAISNTARFGAADAGERLIDSSVRTRMRAVLRDIQDGSFAERMIADGQAGSPVLRAARAKSSAHPIEASGRSLRALLPWLK